ncbi:MAG TPA: hypothetical protein VIO32_07425 [Candidatus Baltobacteraceae bacterium]
MRAAVFIRYHSGDGFGHVAWAFETGDGRVDAGSVENHSGHLFTPASKMGFWNGMFDDPVAPMRAHGYDDLKWIDVPDADPLLAYRTVLWIEHEAYKALHRNCEDDAYDVLRAFGVKDLAPPSFMWFPKSWFRRFRGTLEHADTYRWGSAPRSMPHDDNDDGDQTPWQPTWRRPLHADFHALHLERLVKLATGRA